MSSPKPVPAEPTKTITREPHSAFSALQYRDFRLYWVGQIVSVTGSQMQLVAINWHVYLLTKSPLALGAVGLVRVIPIVLCSLLGGLVADAFDRKRLMLITQTVMLLSAGVLAMITASGLQDVWPIYLLTAIASAATAFDNPARQALLPALVPAEVFTNAVSLGLLALHVSMICGPALAGVILSGLGPGRVDERANEAKRVSLSALREGLSFVWRTPIIVQTMTLDFVATFFASATALLPIFAAEILHVGARGFGVLASAPATGAVVAAFVM